MKFAYLKSQLGGIALGFAMSSLLMACLFLTQNAVGSTTDCYREPLRYNGYSGRIGDQQYYGYYIMPYCLKSAGYRIEKVSKGVDDTVSVTYTK